MNRTQALEIVSAAYHVMLEAKSAFIAAERALEEARTMWHNCPSDLTCPFCGQVLGWTTCPSCDDFHSGNFCPSCKAKLDQISCDNCGGYL